MNTSALSLRALVAGAIVASGLVAVSALGPVSPASAAPAFSADGDSVFVVHSSVGIVGSQNPRKVAGDGTVSTLTLADSSWLLRGGALAPDGTLYIQDASVVPTRVVKIAPDGTESVVATLDFPAAGQGVPTTGDVTMLPDGDLVVSAYRSPNTRFTRVDPSTGTTTTLFTLTSGQAAPRTAADAAGNLYYFVSLTDPKQVWKVSPTVGATPTLVGGTGTFGYDMTVDDDGNVYVAGGVGVSSANHGEIHKLTLQGNGSYSAATPWATTPTVAQGGYSADGGITATPNGQVVLARSDGAGNAVLYRYSSAGGPPAATQAVTGVYPQLLTALPGSHPFSDPVDASIGGTVSVGTALTGSAGTYAPSDAAIAYAWKVGSDPVGTTSSYTPKLADAGKTLTLTVTGTKAGYAASTSTTGQTVATVQGFTGTLKAGQTLTASDATGTSGWGLSTSSSCTSPTISSGTTYALPADSAGKYVQLWQTLNGRTGLGTCVGPIAAATSAPTLTGPATASGVKGQSFTYTPSLGGTPAATVTVTTGTLPAGVTLEGSTGKLSGTPTESGSFPVTFTATNGVGTPPTLNVAITIANVVTGLAPSISGTPQVGAVLAASPGGSLSPTAGDGATVAYQWQYDAAGTWTDLSTGTTYTPGASEVGRVYRVTVTVSKSGYQSRTESSSATSVVVKGTFAIGAPSVTGTAKVGETLTCAAAGGTPGTVSYAWSRGATALGTGSTYELTAADRTNVVTCTVTSVRTGYDDATNSVDSATVDYGTFGIGAPSIAGTAKVGETLTCAAAGGTPGTVTYAWTRAVTLLGNGSTYVLTADDRTQTVTCRVLAQRAGYSNATNATDSATVGYGSFTIGAPSVTGTAAVGETLTCAPAGGTPGTVSYAWTRGATALGTGATYVLTAADRTHEVTCTVTSVRAGYTDATKAKDSATVGYGSFTIGAPSITGTAKVGETLTCAPAAGTPGTVSYAWTRGVTVLDTGATYVLTAADRTHEVTCTVTSVRAGYTDATNAADSATVGYGTFTIAAPSITGTAKVGETLTCAPAAGTPGTVSYAWTRGATALDTGATYELTPADRTHEVTCTVTSVRAGYTDAENAADSETVGYGAFTIDAPSITGTAKVGETLTCAPAAGTPGTVSYAWTRGATALDTGATHELTAADRTEQVTCTVTSVRAGYDDAENSVDSATVGFGSFSIGALSLTGDARVGQTLTCAVPPATPGTVSYAWSRGASALGTGPTYKLTLDDQGHAVTCEATAVRAGYTDAESSVDSAAVGSGTFPIGVLAVTGEAEVGKTLSCAVPPGTPGTATYAWVRGATALGSGPTYRLTAADLSQVVTCTVTVARAGYQDATASAGSATVRPGTAASYRAVVAGTAKVGVTLRARVADLPSAAKVRWQWFRGTTRISGASNARYRLPAEVFGQRVRAVATIRVPGYDDATASTPSRTVGVRRLALSLDRSVAVEGGRVRIRVTDLLPGERWTLAFGNGRRVASGRAPASGGRMVRTVRLPARVRLVDMVRHLGIRTTQPHRVAWAHVTLKER